MDNIILRLFETKPSQQGVEKKNSSAESNFLSLRVKNQPAGNLFRQDNVMSRETKK
jgi:hypothetical protein